MSKANPAERTVELRLLRGGTDEVLVSTGVEFDPGSVTLSGLRETCRKLFGVDAFVLHDGGLLLGEREVTVLMEEVDWRVKRSRPAAPWGDLPLPANVRPWQQPGWFAETLQWLEHQLDRNNRGEVPGLYQQAGLDQRSRVRGERLTWEWEQVSTTDLGCVVRLGSNRGGVYLKVGESSREAQVMRRLAESFPELVPRLVASDESRRVVATRDLGTLLTASTEPEPWVAAVANLAGLHRAGGMLFERWSVQRLEMSTLIDQLRRLLKNRPAMIEWGLKEEEADGLASLLSRVETGVEALSSLHVPSAPLHGDAHPMNVVARQGAVRWFDWSEATVGNPLLDMGWFLAWTSHPGRKGLPVLRREPGLVRRLWLAYLTEAGITGAEDYLEDAMLVALACRAAIYDMRFRSWQGTIPGWRPRYTPYYLKWLWKVYGQEG